MLSKSPNAEEVRTYFLHVESLLSKYQNYIIEGLNKRIGILEYNQKQIYDPKSGVLYIFQVHADSDMDTSKKKI